jgi:hypothetical protein
VIVAALFFYWNQTISLTIYFSLVAVACELFYPKYFKWRYSSITKHIKDSFLKTEDGATLPIEEVRRIL